METRDRHHLPVREFPPARFPRVCRLRNLLADPPWEKDLPAFNWHVHNAVATPDGRAFVIEGIGDEPGGLRQTLLAVDGRTGAERWRRPRPQVSHGSWVFLDPTGELVAVPDDHPGDDTLLLEPTTGEVVQRLPSCPNALGPGAGHVLRTGPARADGLPPGFGLLSRGGAVPQVVLRVDDQPTLSAVFDRSGNLVAWGNRDGTVTVCRLQAVRARLAGVGLGW
jgi:hypothetical protein